MSRQTATIPSRILDLIAMRLQPGPENPAVREVERNRGMLTIELSDGALFAVKADCLRPGQDHPAALPCRILASNLGSRITLVRIPADQPLPPGAVPRSAITVGDVEFQLYFDPETFSDEEIGKVDEYWTHNLTFLYTSEDELHYPNPYR